MCHIIIIFINSFFSYLWILINKIIIQVFSNNLTEHKIPNGNKINCRHVIEITIFILFRCLLNFFWFNVGLWKLVQFWAEVSVKQNHNDVRFNCEFFHDSIHFVFNLRCIEMHSKFVLFVIIFGFLALVSSHLFCSDLLRRNQTKFYAVRHCQRSNKTRIAAKNVANLNKCIQFAEHNQALAFNFGHGKRPRKKGDHDGDLLNLFDVKREKEQNKTKVEKDLQELAENTDPYFNCEVLSCPEVGNMSSIMNDTRFDYYSLYGNGNFL